VTAVEITLLLAILWCVRRKKRKKKDANVTRDSDWFVVSQMDIPLFGHSYHPANGHRTLIPSCCQPPSSLLLHHLRPLRMCRRQNRIPGRLGVGERRPPSNLSIAMSIWVGRAWTPGELAMFVGGTGKTAGHRAADTAGC